MIDLKIFCQVKNLWQLLQNLAKLPQWIVAMKYLIIFDVESNNNSSKMPIVSGNIDSHKSV